MWVGATTFGPTSATPPDAVRVVHDALHTTSEMSAAQPPRTCRRSQQMSTRSSHSRNVTQSGGFPSTTKRSEEHTSELQSLMRISYAVFCLKKKKKRTNSTKHTAS